MRSRRALGALLLGGMILTACGRTQIPPIVPADPAKEAIQVTIQTAQITEVGAQEEIMLSLMDVGSKPIPSLLVTGLMGTWKIHNSLISIGPPACQEQLRKADGDVLSCGNLTPQSTLTIDITGLAREAGSFTYLVSFRDDSNKFNLQETDGKAYQYPVDESVAPPPG